MAKQILVLSARRLLLCKHQGGRVIVPLDHVLQDNRHIRTLTGWNQLFNQLAVSTDGRRFKSATAPLPVERLDTNEEEELPLEVINRKKDTLDLSFEVSRESFA